MGAPGFWDDQETAAKVSAEHARAARKLDDFRELEADVDDLEGLAELADEDRVDRRRARRAARLRRGAPRRRWRRSACSPAATTRRRAGHRQRRAPAAPTRRTGPRWSCAWMMRWAEARGFKVELLEASAGEEAGIKSATFRAGGENAYGLYSAEKGVHRLVRLSPVRRRQPPPDGVRRASRSPRSSRTPARSRSTPTTCRSTPTARRAPAASTSTRPTPPCASPTGRAGSSCSARTSARSPRTGDGDEDAARQARSSCEERERREEIAKEKGEAQDVNFGSQIRSYVLHPYTMVKDHRTDFEMGDAQRRARRRPRRLRPRVAAQGSRGATAREPAAGPSSRPRRTSTRVVAYGFRGSGRFHVPGHKGGAGRRPGAAPRARRPRAGGRHPAGHRGHRPRARRRRPTSAPRRWPPRPTARRGRGFSTNGATQGNHALAPRARAAGRARRRAAQLARVARRRARAQRRAARRSSRPSTTRSSGWPTA